MILKVRNSIPANKDYYLQRGHEELFVAPISENSARLVIDFLLQYLDEKSLRVAKCYCCKEVKDYNYYRAREEFSLGNWVNVIAELGTWLDLRQRSKQI